ncbi:hypothetical protein IF1G_11333 [Cordyceps javanica]|uniref:Uncharacterized protein n=1 Tax=Cordyceps javanica TaxID=43265 RepID=A0A545UKM7_9HYPO|nr:hypothetical protein IF1G_11333 [Cordyceps javanica]
MRVRPQGREYTVAKTVTDPTGYGRISLIAIKIAKARIWTNLSRDPRLGIITMAFMAGAWKPLLCHAYQVPDTPVELQLGVQAERNSPCPFRGRDSCMMPPYLRAKEDGRGFLTGDWRA